MPGRAAPALRWDGTAGRTLGRSTPGTKSAPRRWPGLPTPILASPSPHRPGFRARLHRAAALWGAGRIRPRLAECLRVRTGPTVSTDRSPDRTQHADNLPVCLARPEGLEPPT